MSEDVKPEDGPTSEGEDEGVFSLDDLDQMIAEEDPEFSDSMGKLIDDPQIRDAAVQDIDGEGEAEKEDNKLSLKEKFTIVKKKVVHYFEVFIDFIYFGSIRLAKVTVKRLKQVQSGVSETAGGASRTASEKLKFRVSNFKNDIKSLGQKFLALSIFGKILVFMTLPVMAIMGAIFIFTVTGQPLPRIFVPLTASFAGTADRVVEFNQTTDLRRLHKVFPHKEYAVQFERMVVNLRRDSRSSSVPMAYIELYLATDSQESAIEAKDRQSEFLDIIRQSIERFSYTEFDSPRGKEIFKAEAKKSINELLNRGRVRRIYLKEVIVKR